MLCFALLVPIAPAYAQTTPSTQSSATEMSFAERYQRAMDHYKAERFKEAIQEFEAAYFLQRDPKLLINIGRAHHKLGHGDEAITYYERFLKEDTSHDPAVAERVRSYIQEARTLRPQTAPTDPPTSKGPEASPPVAPPQTAPEASAQDPKAPAPTSVTPAPAIGPVETTRATPVYKKWWFWTTIGLVAAAGATTAAVLLTRPTADSEGIEGLDVRKLQFELRF